jgi:tetratricopeptide (TPR) repeat protein
LAGALLLTALLSKESAIFVPAVPLFWLTARSPAERRALLRRASFRRLLVSLGAAAAAYLALRAAVLGSPVAGYRTAPGTIVVDNPIAGATGAARVLTPISVFGAAVAKLVYPRVLSADYSYTQLPLVRAIDGRTVACALLLAGLAALALGLRVRAPAASFGLVLFLLSWLPTSNLAIVIGTIFGERLLYLPSAGICIAAASGALAFGSRPKLEKAVVVAIALIVATGASRTWTRNRDWTDNLTLFAATAASSPRSCKALDGYASELLSSGRPAEARVWAERALGIHPAYAGAHLTLAKALRALADDERDAARRAELRVEAAEHARILVELFSASAGGGSGLADAWNLKGGLALDDGDADAALDDFTRSLESQPSFVPSLVGSGVAIARQADRESDEARRETLRRAAADRFERALALDPASAEARDNLAILRPADPAAAANLHGLRGTALLKERRFGEALAEFRDAVGLEPRAARGYLGIGTALASQADAEQDAARKRALANGAVEAFEQALAVEPDNPDAHMNIAVTYLRQDREPAKVAEHFRAYVRLVPSAPQRAQIEETIRRMEAKQR